MAAFKDASKEFTPFEKAATPSGRHPRPRIGATAKKKAKLANRRVEAPLPATKPATKKKK